MPKYLTEFLGTLLFVLSIGLIVTPGPQPLTPLMIGGTLMVLVYMGGHVSGGHYNPAVSLAVYLRGKLPKGDLLPYMAAQFLGGTAGAWVAQLILQQTFAPAPGDGVTPFTALLVEIIFTFLLALTVLNVATSPKTQNNSFYGLAIGFVIVVGAFAGGPVSGGAFNPAVGIGSSVINAFVGGGDLTSAWLYLAGPFIGGTIAPYIFKIQERAA